MDLHTIDGGVSESDVAAAHKAGMKELILWSLLHGAALGNQGDATAAAILAAEIEDSR